MKPVLRFAPIILTALFASASFADRPLFSPPPLSTFDGSRWGGLVLEQQTFKDIRPHYETGDGAYPLSTELTLPKNSGVRIDCLWAMRNKDKVLTAITLRYSGVTPSSDQLEKAFDPGATEGQALYLRGRYEDWRIVRFPRRGVTAFQLRDGANYSTPLIMLSSPSNLSRLSGPLQGEETPVVERIDPMADAPKVGEFGEITVDFDGSETDDIPSWVRSDVRNEIRDVSAGGTLRWHRGASGYYRMKVSGSRNKKSAGGSFSVSTEIEAPGPYGLIHVSSYDYESWKPEKDETNRTPSAAFNRAVRDSRRDAEAKYQKAILASGPPSIESIREDQWRELVTVLRAPQSTIPDAPVGPAGTVNNPPVVGF